MEHKIKILSSDIANKIAAGEVVQRPLSVVKELVENSIDAKSTIIKINLSNSGLDEIEVTDNGIGMNKENVELCLLRHATSKVLSEKDIYEIMTLGFRGEALASIAAISQFSLKTSTDGIHGYNLEKNGDEEQKITETSSNKGTSISVKNLFFNTPARYKHLSSTFYELALIIKYVNKAALTNPFIKFELKNNDNELFSSFGDGNVVNVIQKIYNTEIAKNTLSFAAENDHFSVKFYIVKPQITRSKNNNIYIGVNNRIIRNKAIEDMIIKGYGQYLHTNQYPIAYLDIKTDYSLIDINIHPTKEQIKISLINKLEELVVNAISKEINAHEYISKPDIEEYINQEYQKELTQVEQTNLSDMFLSKEELVKKENSLEEKSLKIKEDDLETFEFKVEEIKDLEVKEKEEKLKEDVKDDIKPKNSLIVNPLYIGLFHNTYILFENKKGLYLVDQHAAQERVRYEKILKNIKEKSYNLQRSLVPEIFEFTASEFLLVEGTLTKLEDLGLYFEKFGPNSLRLIEADSFYLNSKEIKNNIRDIIQRLISDKEVSYEEVVDELAISMACKGSIKAHDYTTSDDAYDLLNQLSNCIEPYTCPHGRPIIVNFEEYKIQKMFKRVN